MSSTPATVDAATELIPDETAYFGAPLGTEDGEVVGGRRRRRATCSGTSTCPATRSAATTVVNDLVLTVLLDGTILALDRADGAWSPPSPPAGA